MTVKIYGYLPGWTVPCISPFVTRAINYMKMAGVPYEFVNGNLAAIDVETPHGRLPVIDDGGEKVADSTAIIDYLKKKHGDKLDEGASPRDMATMHAINRMIEGHLYWTSVIQPRWRETPNWEIYLRVIAGTDDVPPGLRTFADDFRHRILVKFMEGGWGRMDGPTLYARARQDIDALDALIAPNGFTMGDAPRSVDAFVSSILRHIIDTPFNFDTKDYAASKPNLKGYLGRMKERFDI